MLKRITIILIVLILINILFINQNSYAICNTVRMKKEISAVKFTLSNGQVLYNFGVKENSSNSTLLNTSQVADAKALDIIFLIDTQTSNLVAEKQVIQTAKESFKNYYSNNLPKLSIGIINFNNNEMSKEEHNRTVYKVKNVATEEDKIDEEIANLQNTNRSILQAVELADSNLQVYGPDARKQQVVVIISDGISNNLNDTVYKDANNRLKNMLEQKMTLVYATISSKTGLEKVLSGLENFISLYNLNILYDLFRTRGIIYNEIIDNVLPSNSNMLEANANNILVSDKIFLFLDTEIAHGATLEVEYLITIEAANGIQNYIIQEDLGNNNLKYNENAKLITENKTNKDVGWRLINGIPVLNGGMGSKNKKAKIVLSTVISVEDFSYTYKNTAICRLSSVGIGETAATTFTRRVESPEISIIPPFGAENKNVTEIYKYIPLAIAIICVAITGTLIIKKKR